MRVIALVAAYNEERFIANCIESLASHGVDVYLIDNCSTDETAAVAEAAGAWVVRPPENKGSKAGAQTFALPFVATEYVMALDADTTLAPDAIERMSKAFEDPEVAAASGSVIPRHVNTVWERGRYVEYMFAFSFYKPIQDYFSKPLISSGCFSIYRTEALLQHGGWSTRTMAEDMDLTWTMYHAGQRVRFVPEAVCYPIEPRNYHFMSKQLRRWSHGFVQNVRLHWRRLLHIPYLRSVVGVALWESTVASVIYLIVLPMTSLILRNPWILAQAADVGSGHERRVGAGVGTVFVLLREQRTILGPWLPWPQSRRTPWCSPPVGGSIGTSLPSSRSSPWR